MDTQILLAYDISHTEFPKTSEKYYYYGTSGFRDKEKELDFILFRMGLLAVLKSKAEKGATVGLMITASHNPEYDNGVKLCTSLGEMIDKEWEDFATELINAKNEDFVQTLKKIASCVDFEVSASVFLGRDTRKSSERLCEAAIAGIKALSGGYRNFDLVTTPQLHYLVVCQNNPTYGEPSLEGYYKKFCGAFEKLKLLKKVESNSKYNSQLFVDGANGVGASKMKELLKHLTSLDVKIYNDGNGVLNTNCGADFVKTERNFPRGTNVVRGRKYASFDGDADRLVYFYGEKFFFNLLDGDKIASLIAKYLQQLIQQAELNLEIRVIQTAYANGRSTSYIEDTLKIPVVCVSTGVKHLHREAKKYDIGVYFEANGHGTVLFSAKAKQKIQELANNPSATEVQKLMAEKLLLSIDLINETVGDAMSDLLLVEAILYDFGWSIEEWDAMYCEKACQLMQVSVPDRHIICTTDADRVCVKPEGLQDAMNEILARYPNSRAFVRASGTEDLVRLYLETDDKRNLCKLSQELSIVVLKFGCEASTLEEARLKRDSK